MTTQYDTKKILGLVKHIAKDDRMRVLSTDQNETDRYKFDEIVRLINLTEHNDDIDFEDPEIVNMTKDAIDYDSYYFLNPCELLSNMKKLIDKIEKNFDFDPNDPNDEDICIYFDRIKYIFKQQQEHKEKMEK
jgi:hypothetical protein